MAFDADTGLLPAKQATTSLIHKLSQGSGLMAAMEQAVAPFTLMQHKSGIGSALVGDRPAIMFANHFAERVRSFLQTNGQPLDTHTVQALIDETLHDVLRHDLTLRLEGILEPVRPYSMAQLAFVYDLLDQDCPLVFGLGPTGTGKTHLSIAAALNQFEKGNVKHIIITKPHEMVQGEQMTPAKRAEKTRDEQFDVYLDILNDFIGQDMIQSMIEARHLEIVPLAALRGRTLSDSIILVDEAQNIDKHWMRLAVTRAGKGSRTFITGDPSLSTLPTGDMSGLAHLLRLIDGHQIGRTHTFQPKDIVRNDTVAQLETLYQQASQNDVELALHRA